MSNRSEQPTAGGRRTGEEESTKAVKRVSTAKKLSRPQGEIEGDSGQRRQAGQGEAPQPNKLTKERNPAQHPSNRQDQPATSPEIAQQHASSRKKSSQDGTPASSSPSSFEVLNIVANHDLELEDYAKIAAKIATDDDEKPNVPSRKGSLSTPERSDTHPKPKGNVPSAPTTHAHKISSKPGVPTPPGLEPEAEERSGSQGVDDHTAQTDKDGHQGEKHPGERSQPANDSDNPKDGQSVSSGVLGSGLGLLSSAFGMRPGPTPPREVRLERDLQQVKNDRKVLRGEVQRLGAELHYHARSAQKYYHEACRLSETLETTNLELRNVKKRYEDAKALSDTRGKELIGAQVFLTKADSLSISDVIQKVSGLNDEIYQAAASLGESIVQKKVENPDQGQEQDGTAKRLLGSPLLSVLRTNARKSNEAANPFLVQVTLQAFLIAFCVGRIQAWSTNNPTCNRFLEDIYQTIQTSCDQAVSGRWRALTRAQLKSDTKEWTHELIDELKCVLAAGSWGVASAEEVKSFEGRLPTIFKTILDVREAIGEKFTSADLEVVTVDPKTEFNNAIMEEAYGEEGHDGPQIAIATTGIGLSKVDFTTRTYQYVLVPKVILEAGLKMALEPPPPRTAQRSKGGRRGGH